jgi:hypothetical protein
MSLGDYGIAAERKLCIAQFHLDALKALLPVGSDSDGLPPIALQAHFEASGWATMAIVDQVVSGIGSQVVGDDRIWPKDLLEALPESDLREWVAQVLNDPRYLDLKSWRNRSVHRFDMKAYHDGEWSVLEPTDEEPYGGPRVIQSHLEEMLAFGQEVVDRLDDVTSWLQGM